MTGSRRGRQRIAGSLFVLLLMAPPGRAQGSSYRPGVGPANSGAGSGSVPTHSTALPLPPYSWGAPYTPPPIMFPRFGVMHPGLAGPGMGYGMALQGLASYTQAQGQYWNDIQRARILREQSRQAAIDTQRKRLEWEMEYERLRPTAPKMMAAQRANELNWARNYAASTQIWSGWALNVLLRSILASPAPTKGPHISLDPETVRGLNLTDGSARGSLALTRDEGRIDWTESLREPAFDELRGRFAKTYKQALEAVGYGKTPGVDTLRELRSILSDMGDKLNDMVSDLTPSRFIESRRLLNNLGDTVRGLSNPRLVKAANQDWWKSIRTVADLVAHCQKNGLEFGPAVAPADFPAYTAAYFALRAYEREVAGAALTSS